jgi:hypothetical protein
MHESTNLASGDLPRPEMKSRFDRAKILRNKVKRLLIKSHYLFVANAAAWSCISGGLLGLNGSQANKSQSLLLYLPYLRRSFGEWWAAVSFVGSRSKARRPEASGLSFCDPTFMHDSSGRGYHFKRRNRAETQPSITAFGRLHRSESWLTSRIGGRRPAGCPWRVRRIDGPSTTALRHR